MTRFYVFVTASLTFKNKDGDATLVGLMTKGARCDMNVSFAIINTEVVSWAKLILLEQDKCNGTLK